MDEEHPLLGAQALYARARRAQMAVEVTLAIISETHPDVLDRFEDLVVAIRHPGDSNEDREALLKLVANARKWEGAIAEMRRTMREGPS